MRIREPAVAGYFYPTDPRSLAREVDGYLAAAPAAPVRPKAIVAPHAGYVYSGPVAAYAYAAVAPAAGRVRRVVLLGPSHRVYLRGLALPDAQAFRTPLGLVTLDVDAMARISELRQVQVLDAAHAREHSLEVQLPFLQRALGEVTVVPLVAGDASPEDVAQVIDALWDQEHTLVVVSSDLSHYHDYLTAKRIDGCTTEAIERLDASAIGPEQACGCVPLAGLLEAARERQMRVLTLCTANSGDTAGPRDRVVGYGAYAVH